MKRCKLIMAGGIAAASLGLWACNPQDTSALEEIERLRAELALAKQETEQAQGQLAAGQAAVDEMRAQLADAAGTLKQAVAAKAPTPEELHQKLGQEMFKLQKEAEKQLPNYTIREVTFGDVKVPSLDYPFSCQVRMTLVSPSGQSGKVYFKGRGNPAGEWTFDQLDPAEAAVAEVPATPVAPAPADPPPIASNPSPEVTPEVPAGPREKTVSERLREQAEKRGAMQAEQTRIIDLSKMQPLNIR